MAADGAAAGVFDGEVRGRAGGGKLRGDGGEFVEVAAGFVFDRVGDLDGLAGNDGGAGVAGLAAHLGVEGGAVEDDEGVFVGLDDIGEDRVDGFGGVDRVAGEER